MADLGIEPLLSNAMEKYAIDAITLYMTSPLWDDTLALLGMKGVRYPEAVHALSIAEKFERMPQSSRDVLDLFLPDATKDVLRRGISAGVRALIARDPERNRLFGDFIEREGIKSRVWFVFKRHQKVHVALSFNYRQSADWTIIEKNTLRSFVRLEVLPLVTSLEHPFSQLSLLSLPRLLNFLHRSWHAAAAHARLGAANGAFDDILHNALAAFGVSREDSIGTIHMLESDSRALVLKEAVGDFERQQTHSHSLDTGEGVIAWVAHRKQAILINDLRSSGFVTHRIHVDCLNGANSEFAVPIVDGEDLIGVLNLESRKRNAFSWDGVQFLSHAAAQAAVLYSLNQHVCESRRNQQLALEMLKICSDAPLLVRGSATQRPLNRIVGIAQQYLNVDMIDVWQCLDEKCQRFDCRGATYEIDTSLGKEPRRHGWTAFVLTHRQPIWIRTSKDTSGRPTALVFDDSLGQWCSPREQHQLPEQLNDRVSELGVLEEVGLPVLIGHRPLGVVWFKWKQSRSAPGVAPPLGEMRGFAGQVALVLHCLESEEKTQFDEAAILDRIIRICLDIVQEPNIADLEEHITQWVSDGMHAEICSLFLRDDDDPNWLCLRAASGYPKELIGVRTHLVGQGITGTIVKQGITARCNSPEDVRRFPGWRGILDRQRGGECRNLLGCPIILHGKEVVGTLKVENRRNVRGEASGFSAIDEEVLKAVCAVLAFRMQNDEMQRGNWQAARIGEFLHTFSSPLTTVRWMSEGALSLLSTMPDSEIVRTAMSHICENAKRFQLIVENAGFFTKRNPHAQREQTDVVELVLSLVREFQAYANRKDVDLRAFANHDALLVNIDPTLVRYLLENLIQNAIEYGGGRVAVACEADDVELRLLVEDSGPGVSSEELALLKIPYFRGNQSRILNVDGAGLGLSVCEKAATCLGGRLSFKPNSPTGLVAVVELPIGRAGALVSNI